MKNELNKILDLSYDHCKHDDDDLATFFRAINENAYLALKHLEKHPDTKDHWTQKHYKNYHMN
jgi:hypothetical protein